MQNAGCQALAREQYLWALCTFQVYIVLVPQRGLREPSGTFAAEQFCNHAVFSACFGVLFHMGLAQKGRTQPGGIPHFQTDGFYGVPFWLCEAVEPISPTCTGLAGPQCRRKPRQFGSRWEVDRGACLRVTCGPNG